MSYFINEECIGCTICAKKCPVPCIWGDETGVSAKTKDRHIIEPGVCIDCGVCASYCPVDCIHNDRGVVETKIEAKHRPVALVQEKNCTGCEWCVDACPFDCIEMVIGGDDPATEFFKVARVSRMKDCVG